MFTLWRDRKPDLTNTCYSKGTNQSNLIAAMKKEEKNVYIKLIATPQSNNQKAFILHLS